MKSIVLYAVIPYFVAMGIDEITVETGRIETMDFDDEIRVSMNGMFYTVRGRVQRVT